MLRKRSPFWSQSLIRNFFALALSLSLSPSLSFYFCSFSFWWKKKPERDQEHYVKLKRGLKLNFNVIVSCMGKPYNKTPFICHHIYLSCAFGAESSALIRIADKRTQKKTKDTKYGRIWKKRKKRHEQKKYIYRVSCEQIHIHVKYISARCN